MSKTDELFKQVLEEVKNDENFLGCVLVGSRGKGFENEHSDYDAVLIVKDGIQEHYKQKYEKLGNPEVELKVMSLDEYREHAAWGSAMEWDRYDYAHVKILVDKTNQLESISQQKGNIPEEARHDFVSRSLDAYINHVFRSVKCHRSNNLVGARLEAAASIPFLLDVVFGFEGRVKPFLGYIEKELTTYPLVKMPWDADTFIQSILRILETADLQTQQQLLKDVEQVARKEGFGKVFDEWEGKDQWTMTFSPQ